MLKKLKFLERQLYTLLCILFFIPYLYGQTNGRIAGRVIEAASENPLAGVNVLVRGTFLGSSSDTDGYFIILNVPPGEYEVEASMVGYTTVMKTEIQVSLERTVQVNFELEEATLEGETVVIVAERDILHKEVSSAQQVISPIQIESAAGVNTLTEFIAAQAGITDSRLLEIRGGSAEQTGSLVNGLSFVNVRIGKAEATVPLSAVEQVSLQSGGYAAEYGNFRSGLINITTKSGEKNKYHGSINYTRNTPAQKRFGKSLYDTENYFLKTTFDPVLAFEGSNQDSWEQLITGDSAEAAYQKQQYESPSWKGWNMLVDRYNRGLDPNEVVSTMDLYLWNAWMHMIVPDFEKLEELYPELTTENPQYNDPNIENYRDWDEIKSAFRKHEAQKEGENADWDLDLGFGGPVPFVSSALGDATFFLSHKATNDNYVQPVMREGEKSNITMLTLKSNISQNLSVKVHGLYRFIRGTQSNFPTNGDIPDIDEGGDTMPIQNLGTVLGSGPNSGSNAYGGSLYQYAYHPTFWQPKDQKVFMGGLTINQIINDKTFLDVVMSYAYQLDKFEPKETRNSEPLINFGPIWLNERPYGITFAPDTVFYGDGQYFAPDPYEAAYQIGRRHASKVGQFHENSVTQQFKFKVDFSNQYNRSNFFKSGVELNYFDIDNDNWRWWYGHDTIYEMRDRRKPYQLGYYIQDQISLESMEARIGLRFDYYNSGGGVWPADKYNEDAFTAGSEGANQNQLYEDLLAGKTVIWDRWRAIDDSLGGTFLEKTKNHFTVSPRLGIAFPITESSKFFFNYGHFRSPVPYSEQFFYKMRFFKNGLSNIGNPNLEPPRTISYELGVAYNLLNNYLIELSTYYKDVSGESAQVNYHNDDNTLNYAVWLNNRWEDDMGFELKITKNLGKYLTGWLNFWYVIDKNGRVGAQHIWEQEERNTPDQYYGGDENSPSFAPRIAANITLSSPVELGPEYVGIHPLGDWRLSLFPRWERGSQFTFNPANTRNLQNNLRWPDYHKVDLKLSKGFNIKGVTASIFLDVRNVFNTKINWMRYDYAFSSEADKTKYLSSLHLPEYKDKTKYPEGSDTEYISGNDKVGDLRSDDKPYINDPDVKMFLYGQPRQVWFGLRLSF